MIKLPDVRDYFVRPALQRIGAWSRAAELLVIGTGLVESGYDSVKQSGHGPALGFWQMEPATHDSIWNDYLVSRPALRAGVLGLVVPTYPKDEQLIYNAIYAAAMCRIKYLWDKQMLPNESDLEGLAAYYKRVYNTPLGAGSAERFMRAAQDYGLMTI